MLLPDVNILVYAQREDSLSHTVAKNWLESALNGSESVGLFAPTLSSFLRIVTNRRIFEVPTPQSVALSFIQAIQAAPAALPLNTGPMHWEIFVQLCRETGSVGNDVPDAYLAAIAIEKGCEFVSTDVGFARFAGLKWRKPF